MILFRYISTAILQSTFAVTLVLLLIVTSGRLAKYLSKASSGELAPELVFSIILYRIPDFLPLILPLGLFVGTLLVYGRMYIDSEMTSISAAGTSKWQLLLITLGPALLISMLVAALTLWLAPASLAKVEAKYQAAKNFQGLLLFREGKFQSDKKGNRIIYVERMPDKRSFETVFLLEQSRSGKVSMLLAEGGDIQQAPNNSFRQLTLNKGKSYEGTVGRRDYQISRFEQYTQNIQIDPEQEDLDLEIDALPTLEILASATAEQYAALHWRFSLPATVIVVGILALALSKTDRRQGRYMAMLPAIGLYLVYLISLSAARSAVEESDSGATSLWVIHLLFLCLALLLLFRTELFLRLQQRVPK